ncbi:unnamed protein product, partial [Strongylus vulgaris]
MQFLLLSLTIGVTFANYVSQNSGYEDAETGQPGPANPPTSDGGDQQAYNMEGGAPIDSPPVGGGPRGKPLSPAGGSGSKPKPIGAPVEPPL